MFIQNNYLTFRVKESPRRLNDLPRVSQAISDPFEIKLPSKFNDISITLSADLLPYSSLNGHIL